MVEKRYAATSDPAVDSGVYGARGISLQAMVGRYRVALISVSLTEVAARLMFGLLALAVPNMGNLHAPIIVAVTGVGALLSLGWYGVRARSRAFVRVVDVELSSLSGPEVMEAIIRINGWERYRSTSRGAILVGKLEPTLWLVLLIVVLGLSTI